MILVIVVIVFPYGKILHFVKTWSYIKYASGSGINTAYSIPHYGDIIEQSKYVYMKENILFGANISFLFEA